MVLKVNNLSLKDDISIDLAERMIDVLHSYRLFS